MFAELRAAAEKGLQSALPLPFVFDKEAVLEFLKARIVPILKEEANKGATRYVLDYIIKTDGSYSALAGTGIGSRWIQLIVNWTSECRDIKLSKAQLEVFRSERSKIAKEIVEFIRDEWKSFDPTVASILSVDRRVRLL